METVIENKPKLLINDNPKNANINQGNKDVILTLLWLVVIPSEFLALMCALIIEKISTVGMIESVRVSFTIVAKSPATSLKAYPAATTLEVSFTAVPAHSPYAISRKK